jgi:hypothetical protein
MSALEFHMRLRNGSTAMRIGKGREGIRKGREGFRCVVRGWSVAKKSSNATACIARGGFKTDGRYAARFGGVR